jgi:hypothetical protein
MLTQRVIGQQDDLFLVFLVPENDAPHLVWTLDFRLWAGIADDLV